jgi:thiol-disulfide isomerase/thioredoxin
MKPNIRIALAVVALALAGISRSHPAAGDTPPDFLGHDRHGADVRVSGFHGKVVIVSFWASWCSYCLKEMPILAAIQKKVGPEQLQVVGVNHNDDLDTFRKIRYRWKDLDVILTYESADNSISRPYGIKGLPYMVMIGRDGRIAYIHVGYGEDELNGILAELQDLLDAPAPAPGAAVAGAAGGA